MSEAAPPPFGTAYQGRRPKYQPGEHDPRDHDRQRHYGFNPIPAPEPFPDGPLRWTLTRLDQDGRADAEDPRHD